jgi:hypothetical protein
MTNMSEWRPTSLDDIMPGRGFDAERFIPMHAETPDSPDFENATRVHDWRNHVGDRLKAIWGTFTPEQRLAIALDAQDRASNEEWD